MFFFNSRQAVAVFLTKDRLRLVLDPIDQATALIAAAAHDVDHPGRSSAFLANSANPLAILYNDITVLESHHAACTFKLTLSKSHSISMIIPPFYYMTFICKLQMMTSVIFSSGWTAKLIISFDSTLWT